MLLMVASHCLLQTSHSSDFDFLWPNLACTAATFFYPVLLYPRHGHNSSSFIHQSTILWLGEMLTSMGKKSIHRIQHQRLTATLFPAFLLLSWDPLPLHLLITSLRPHPYPRSSVLLLRYQLLTSPFHPSYLLHRANSHLLPLSPWETYALINLSSQQCMSPR